MGGIILSQCIRNISFNFAALKPDVNELITRIVVFKENQSRGKLIKTAVREHVLFS